MNNKITKDTYKKTEALFYSQLKRELGSNLAMYCVTGSLSRNEVIPGWSDIDTLIVLKKYTPNSIKKIGSVIRANSRLIKIGTTIYQLEEFNYGLFNDPKTHNVTQLILKGKVKPKIFDSAVIFKKLSKRDVVKFNGVEITKQLHTLKRELIKENSEEPLIYKTTSNILRSLLLMKGITPQGYNSIWENARQHLVGFHFKLINPRDILNQPGQKKSREREYFQILAWVTNYKY